VPDEEIEIVVDYLAKNFGTAKKQPATKKSPASSEK
jgi:hypothetical protein